MRETEGKKENSLFRISLTGTLFRISLLGGLRLKASVSDINVYSLIKKINVSYRPDLLVMSLLPNI